MSPRTAMPDRVLRGEMPALRQTPGARRKSHPSFDLVLAFAILGIALVSAVALVGGLAYSLPAAMSLMLWGVPLFAVLLVGFAVFIRKRQ